MSKLQEILTQGMQKAGQVVEKISAMAGKRKPAKPKKTGVQDESGEDFGAIQWDERHIMALLTGAERKEVSRMVPSLANKRALHITPGKAKYIEIIEKRGTKDVVELDVAKSSVGSDAPQEQEYPFARGSVEKLPFKSKTFDFILYPSALAWRADLPLLVPEISRCLKDNGRFVIASVHPFFEYLMNPRGGFRKNIGKLYSDFRKNGFFIEDLHEGTLDETLRHVSLPSRLTSDLKRFQGMPIVLVMRGILLKKRKA